MKTYYKKLNQNCTGNHKTKESHKDEIYKMITESALYESMEMDLPTGLSDEEYMEEIDKIYNELLSELKKNGWLDIGDYELTFYEHGYYIARNYLNEYLDDGTLEGLKRELEAEGFRLTKLLLPNAFRHKEYYFSNEDGDKIRVAVDEKNDDYVVAVELIEK